MAAFPSTLPCPLNGSVKTEYIDGIVQDSGETGIRKRRRTTRVLKMFSFTMRLTYAQQATWDTFYETTINYGLTSFTWTYDGTSRTVELVQAPEVSEVSGAIKDYNMTFREI